MRIDAPGTDSHGVDSRRTLLRVLQPSPGRPCRGCVQPCPCSGSPICDCNCSRACPYVPAELSSDPTRHPIESKIVSLVYELNTFNGIEPCWSCEGHVGPAGTMSRIPQVWFYVSDRLIPHVMESFIQDVCFRERLNVRWIVTICNFGTSTMAYACRPDPWDVSKAPSLERMQQDASVLACRFKDAFHKHVGANLGS